VEEPKDIMTIEKAGNFNGLYHVLLGSLSPLDGIGPAELKIKELTDRVRKEKLKEIIIATDFNTEGEATALYLLRVLKGSGVKLTRVAYGIPVGGGLEYADQATIAKAFEGRREL
jgi:recombination protein RecR